jgi:tetratricopeptide (TPR) repeat protein
MPYKKYKLLILLLFITSLYLSGQYRSEVYNAYIFDRMEQWKSVIDRMETVSNKNNEFIQELVNYQYGYIGYCIEFKKTEDAKKYYNQANENVEKLEKSGYNISTINSYKAALYGIRISFNKLSAPFNGPKSLNYAETALKQDSSNYLANIQYGNALSNMPEAFGGSKSEALKYYLRAKQIFERNPALISQNWNYMNLMILIGRTYSDLKDYSSAKFVYEIILAREPDFIYVKKELYPKLLEEMKN